MELAKLFAQASRKLMVEFETSADFHNPGSMGTYREEALKNFLEQRLPQRYGIDSGHVLGPIVNESKQLDCVILDNNICPAVVVSDSFKFFPVEGVLGAIEVKSQLTKTRLIEGLENIASFKALVPRDTIQYHVGGYGSGFFSAAELRPMPFGMVFAYGLGDNSLESLAENLREWEGEHDPASGANAIAVLDQGIILHVLPDLRPATLTEQINPSSRVVAFHYGKNTLFEFYLMLMRLISTINLGPVEWEAYRKPARRVGGHVVKGGHGLVRAGDTKTYAVTAALIEKLVTWASASQKVSLFSVLQHDFGSVPTGTKDRQLYFYNPEDLPGVPMLLSGAISNQDVMAVRSSVPSFQLIINNEEFLIPQAYLSDSDFEATGEQENA
jgi:hypothetical protein